MLNNRFYSTNQVAEIEGMSLQMVRRFLRSGRIYPAIKSGQGYAISIGYTIIRRKAKSTSALWDMSADTAQLARKNRPGAGRPKGSKNKNPYPKGVKRPRKKVTTCP